MKQKEHTAITARLDEPNYTTHSNLVKKAFGENKYTKRLNDLIIADIEYLKCLQHHN